MKLIGELNPHNYPTNKNIDNNLKTLFERLQELQDAVGYDLTITSGLRSDEQQASLILAGKTNARHSMHLSGNAADIYDPDGTLKLWANDNLNFFVKTGFWMEAFESTPTWLHVQIQSPKSGNRIFIP